ncbi:DNA polymerase [Aeromonas media]
MSLARMTKKYCIFLYLKDFQLNGGDRYFLLLDNFFREVKAKDLLDLDCYLVTHDYYTITDSIYKSVGKLPKSVIDITHFKRFILQQKVTNENKEQFKTKEIIKNEFDDINDLRSYFEIYYRKEKYTSETYMLFSHKLSNAFEKMLVDAEELDEIKRYFDIEVPTYNIIYNHLTRGIKIDCEILKEHKKEINERYFKELKFFSETFGFMYEIPSENELSEYLSSRGYNLENESLDYILNFIPMPDDFGEIVRKLQRTNATRNTLLGIPHSKKSITPYVDLNGSITSRIYIKSPNLQNISKRYRNILIPSQGKELSYIDYDQFEIGIMAHYSQDENLISMYSGHDIYSEFSSQAFGTPDKRKIAKMIFLSFIYGMTQDNLLKAVEENNGNKEQAKTFFSTFSRLEEWREEIAKIFHNNGKIPTQLGNYFKREHTGPLTSSEKRSCVSQVIQGTGSLIFKKAIINISKNMNIKIILPMHDALLVQHPTDFDTDELIKIFVDSMSEILGESKITPKASLSNFYAS